MRIGVVACGYADGLSAPRPFRVPDPGERTAYAHGGARLNGYALRRSRICPMPASVRWSCFGAKRMPVEEVAAAAGTVSYELLCALATRVPVVELQ